MNDYQHQQLLTLLRAIALGTIGVALTVLSFVAGQIAIFLGASNDDARLTTFFAAAFGATFTIVSLALVFLPVRHKYEVTVTSDRDKSFL